MTTLEEIRDMAVLRDGVMEPDIREVDRNVRSGEMFPPPDWAKVD